MEREVYQQIAMGSNAFAFQWSHWNNDSGRDQLVMRACNCSTPDQWKLLREGQDPEEVSLLTEVCSRDLSNPSFSLSSPGQYW